MKCPFCNQKMLDHTYIAMYLCKEHNDVMVLFDDMAKMFSLCKKGYEIYENNSKLFLTQYPKTDDYRFNHTIYYYALDFDGYYYASSIKSISIPASKNVKITIDNFDNIKNKIQRLSTFS